jgi:PPP family 3-phenylpropionic acid transporter
VNRGFVFRRAGQHGDTGLRLAAFYVAIFLLIGCYMPFLPLWLKWRGMSDFQISLFYAVPVLLRALFIPVMTFAADRWGRPVRMLCWLAWGSLLSVALLPFVDGFPALFAVVLVFTLFWMSVIPITDSVALAAARDGHGDYGRMRVWGSISFIAMTSGGGAAIDLWGPGAAVWLFVGSAAVVLIAVHWLPDERGVTMRSPPRLADMLKLVRSPELWLFLIATSAVQSGHVVYYVFGTLHWTSLGISPTAIGALWGIGVVAEVVMFIYLRQVGLWIGPVQLIALGGAAALLRWAVTALNPPLVVLFPLQMLHGLTFGGAHAGAMQFLSTAVPPHMAASAQGLYAAITAGLAMGLGSLAVTPLYRALGGEAYFAMAALGLVGLAFALALMHRWNGGLIMTGKE